MPSGMHSSFTSPNKKSSHPVPRSETVTPTINSAPKLMKPSSVRPVVIGQPSRTPAASYVRDKPRGNGQARSGTAGSLTLLKIPDPSPPSPVTHRPFSPSALASRSGKTIKAFFRHRHADAESHGTLQAQVGVQPSTTTSAKRSSAQAKQDVVGLPSISVRLSPELGLPVQPAVRSSPADQRRISLKPSECKVQFPKVDEDDIPAQKLHEEDASKRKPRRSLSFFRSASKPKPIVKISSPQLVDSCRDEGISLQSTHIPKQRPKSAPAPARLSVSGDDHHRLTLDPKLPASGSIETQSSHTLTSTKALPPAANEMDPRPPDRFRREGTVASRLLPLTSMHSATTTTSAHAIADPDLEPHYMLRMACTYLTKTILPEVKAARNSTRDSPQPPTTASEKADVLRRHVHEKIKLLERMERAWGIDWMLRGKDGFTISDARKEKERETFRKSVEDGVVMCFLLLRLNQTKSAEGRGILLSSAIASRSNLALASDMATHLPLEGDDAGLAASICNLSGKGIYTSGRLIVAIARLAGPHKSILAKNGLDASNPTSDDEEATSVERTVPQPSRVTLAFQKPIERPPFLIRRLSSKSSTSGASTPKPPEDIKLPALESPSDQHTKTNTPDLPTGQPPEPPTRTSFTPRPLPVRRPSSQMIGASPPPMRRPILRVKQSFAGSVTSDNTSTADSRSRTSGWHPQFIPEDTVDLAPAEILNADPRCDAPSATSPTRTVSFGISDEQAQQQVKTFRSQTRYRVRGAKPKFSQESLSTCEIAIADEEEKSTSYRHKDSNAQSTNATGPALEQQFLPSTPKREHRSQTRVITPQRITSPTQLRYARPSSGVSMNPFSPIAFPGTPPRTPRNHSGVLPTSLAGSRRTSFASSNGDSSSNRHSRQTIEVVVSGKRNANYQLGNCIGKGQFGVVYRGLNLADGQFVAIKRIDIKGSKGDEVGQIMKEVVLLQRLKHPSIVRYLGMARSEESLDIVLEFIEGGSLAHSVKSFGYLNEDLVAGYVGKILEGLNYLHGQHVVHCDLKAANILTTKTGNVKLSDFGVSLNLKAAGHPKQDVVGSPNWMAPEVIELKGITTAADIWSLGATVIELLTGRPPYYDMHNGMAVMYRIVDEGMEIPESCSPGLSDFLKQCFRKNPQDRPTAEELFEHEWVKSRIELDPNLRHHDSIPFLRRISTDAFKLHAERMVDDSSPSPRSQQCRPITPDVSSGLEISAAQRGSIPDFVAPSMVPDIDSDVARLANMQKDPVTSQGTETARVRQSTRDKLNTGSFKQQVPSLNSNKSEGSRARLFSVSSLSGRRKSQSGVDVALEIDVAREVPEGSAGERGSPAVPGASPSSPGAASWLSASALTTGLLYSGYDANKDPKNEAKSDCSVM